MNGDYLEKKNLVKGMTKNEYFKLNYIKNKEQIQARKKILYIEKKQQIKSYYENNKDHILKLQKIRYENLKKTRAENKNLEKVNI